LVAEGVVSSEIVEVKKAVVHEMRDFRAKAASARAGMISVAA
jgi:hypothetical protein